MKRLLVGLLLSTCIGAQLSAATTPPNETIIRDVPRLVERVKAGPFGQIWRHKELELTRSMVMGTLLAMSGEQLPLMEELLADLRSVILMGDVEVDLTGGDLGGTTIALHLPTRADQAVAFLQSDIAKGSFKVPVQRLGEWVVLGKLPADEKLLRIPAEAIDDHDIHSSNDLTSLLQNPDTPPEAVAVLNALGLKSVRHRIRFDEQGTREEADFPGMKLPLMPIDPATLSCLPDGQVMVGALGFDGVDFDELLAGLSQNLPALAEFIAERNRDSQTAGQPTLTAMLRGWKGTMWFAAALGAPFPTFTIGCPTSPEIDAVFAAAAIEAKIDLAAASTEAQVLPLPPGLPLLLQIRRTKDQWVLSSDQRVMDALATNTPGGFRPPKLDPTTTAFFIQDTAGLVRMGMGYLPLVQQVINARGGENEMNNAMKVAMVAKVLNAALPHLHPSEMMLLQGPQGATVRSKNMLTGLMPMSIAAGLTLPVIAVTRAMARRTQSGKNMSQIFGAMIAWTTDKEKWPPPSFEQLAKDMSIPKKLFQSPSNPAHPNPYLFVTSVEDPPPAQPVLIEDPACYKNQGTMVCFGDAHVKWIKGPDALRLWQEAKRLAALPKATMGGIELSDWSEVNDVLGIAP